MVKKKVILIIRDGWGYRELCEDNCICQTPTPFTDELMKKYPNVLLNASGEAVGLPDGYQGNSEVGHITIGSGRIVNEPLQRINKSIESGEFFSNTKFISAIENCKNNNTTLHLIGLLQTQGVHSHINHLLALLDLCKQQDFTNVVVHVITDGRDAPITESIKHVNTLLKKFEEIKFGKIVTINGRYYAMDRDKRWDRTKKAYDCIVNGEAEEEFKDPIELLNRCHSRNETDEFIIPKKAKGYEGIKKKDSIIFFNFRTDRPRQLTQAIVENEFPGWKREALDVVYVGMTTYYKSMNAEIAFGENEIPNHLGELISKNGLKQLRISETEKYAHVTFFFNGEIEKPYEGEDRILIPSPKVATYDKKPEMSIYGIIEKMIPEIEKQKYDLIVCNLVNGDMVGHTGVVEAITKAVSAVDDCVGKISKAGIENDYNLIIFADHGNAEDQTPEWRTSHTLNPVPCIIVNNKLIGTSLKSGMGLKDIAPTVLKLMGLKQPEEMTGESLF